MDFQPFSDDNMNIEFEYLPAWSCNCSLFSPCACPETDAMFCNECKQLGAPCSFQSTSTPQLPLLPLLPYMPEMQTLLKLTPELPKFQWQEPHRRVSSRESVKPGTSRKRTEGDRYRVLLTMAMESEGVKREIMKAIRKNYRSSQKR